MVRRRTGWGVALAGAALVTTAACATAPSAGGTTPAGDVAAAASGGTDAASGSSPASPAWAEEFTACMRANGEPGFPDITVTGNGSIYLDSTDPDLDVFSSAYRKAFATCRHFLPDGVALPTPPTEPPTPPPTELLTPPTEPPAPTLPAPTKFPMMPLPVVPG